MNRAICAMAVIAFGCILAGTAPAQGIRSYGDGSVSSFPANVGSVSHLTIGWTMRDFTGTIMGNYNGSIYVEVGNLGDLMGDGRTWGRPIIHLSDVSGNGGYLVMGASPYVLDGQQHSFSMTMGMIIGGFADGQPFGWDSYDGQVSCSSCTEVIAHPNHGFYADGNGQWYFNSGSVGDISALAFSPQDYAVTGNPAFWMRGNSNDWYYNYGFAGGIGWVGGYVDIQDISIWP